VQLTKHHGLGNDFLVALVDRDVARFDGALARRVCHRKTGIGADGLIIGVIAPGPDVDLQMILFNADGSRAEISGNGIRCLAQAEVMRRGLRECRLQIATDAGLRTVGVRSTSDPAVVEASVTMGRVRSGPVAPPLPAGVTADRWATADIGNPHWVMLVDEPSRVDVGVIGPRLESLVAGGINVEFIAPTKGVADELDLVVWERGAGATDACGSGASAAAHVAHQWGLVGDNVVVHMPGGAARVVLDGDEATLIGPAVFVARVELMSD
jgi:diaminopimelate epimerase